MRLLEAFEAAARGAAQPARPCETALDGLERDGDGWQLHARRWQHARRPPLVVGADGKKSLVRAAAGFRAREHGFTQAALVCDLELGRPLGGTSVEFHYPHGPFTLVPAGGNRANLVWIDDREVLEAAQARRQGRACARIFREKSQRLFGDIELLTPAHMFPLSTLTRRPSRARDGVVLVGEAAHAFPPIGAQGLNLGLRDVADLAAALAQSTAPRRIGRIASARDYAARRAADLARTGTMVDTLFRSLLADMLPAQALRAGGLWALKLLPALRKQAFRARHGRPLSHTTKRAPIAAPFQFSRCRSLTARSRRRRWRRRRRGAAPSPPVCAIQLAGAAASARSCSTFSSAFSPVRFLA